MGSARFRVHPSLPARIELVFYRSFVGMNPKKTERWPIPAGTRHVWIMQKYRYEIPVQGYVIDRKKQSSEWVALVAYVEAKGDDQALIQRWLPMSRLKPVYSKPEDRSDGGPY